MVGSKVRLNFMSLLKVEGGFRFFQGITGYNNVGEKILDARTFDIIKTFGN